MRKVTLLQCWVCLDQSKGQAGAVAALLQAWGTVVFMYMYLGTGAIIYAGTGEIIYAGTGAITYAGTGTQTGTCF